MPPPTPDSPHNVQSPTMIYHTDNMDIKWSQFQSLSHELQSERSRMKLELETMKRTLRERETELQDCREQILRTVSTFQVSDSSILDELVKIRDSLCNLILVLPDITGFDQTWRTVHSTMIEKDSASRMKITLKPEGRLDIIQAELIEHDIFYLVWNTLLRPTLAGLPDQQQLFWAKILEQRAKMEPLQDPKAIATWRSDTYRALTSTNDYQDQLHKRCTEIDTHVVEYLRKFSFSKYVDWECLHQRIMDQVLKPAATLGTALTCSPEDYSWSSRFSFHTRVEEKDLQEFDFIDNNTHCLASRANMCGIQDLSKAGHHIAPIFPGLYREVKKGSVTIQKPLVLVSFKDEPPTPSSPSEASVLEVPPYRPPPTRRSSRGRNSVLGRSSSFTATRAAWSLHRGNYPGRNLS